jgi:uncharacterized protein
MHARNLAKHKVSKMKTNFFIAALLLAGFFAVTLRETANAHTESFESLQAACIAGNQSACTDAGIRMTDGNGTQKDEVRGAQLFLTACTQNDARACMLWGYALENGRGIAMNLSEARKAYEGGCSGGNALGCNNVGLLYHAGKGGPRDESMAQSFYSKACEMELGLGCRNLGVLHADAQTLPQSRVYAVTSFDKACRLGDMDGCNKQAWHAEQGLGTVRDLEKARTLYAKACNAQYALACQNAQLLAAKFPVPASSTKSAALPDAPVAISKTDTIPAKNNSASTLDESAKMKDPEYLHTMGGNAYSLRDFVKAREYYNKACLAGRGVSCGYAGLLYHDALGGKKDFAKSFPLFKKGCDAKDGFFCKYVGDAYANGEGVKKNAKTAQKFYKKACDLGDHIGCAYIK